MHSYMEFVLSVFIAALHTTITQCTGLIIFLINVWLEEDTPYNTNKFIKKHALDAMWMLFIIQVFYNSITK